MNKRIIKKITVEYYIGKDDVFTNDGLISDKNPLSRFRAPEDHVIGDFVVNYVPGKNIHIKSDVKEVKDDNGN